MTIQRWIVVDQEIQNLVRRQSAVGVLQTIPWTFECSRHQYRGSGAAHAPQAGTTIRWRACQRTLPSPVAG